MRPAARGAFWRTDVGLWRCFATCYARRRVGVWWR